MDAVDNIKDGPELPGQPQEFTLPLYKGATFEAANGCIATGNIRFLDRIYIIDHYIEEMTRDIMQMKKDLRDALHRGQAIEI